MVIPIRGRCQEFNNMSIPGGVDCPGAELVYRVQRFRAWTRRRFVVVDTAPAARARSSARSR